MTARQKLIVASITRLDETEKRAVVNSALGILGRLALKGSASAARWAGKTTGKLALVGIKNPGKTLGLGVSGYAVGEGVKSRLKTPVGFGQASIRRLN